MHELIAGGHRDAPAATRRRRAPRWNARAQAARIAPASRRCWPKSQPPRRCWRAPAARLHRARDRSGCCRSRTSRRCLASEALVVDACRYVVREAGNVVPLARRPVLFTLARVLAEAWPGDAPRDALVARAFRAKQADESYRARLRVEIGPVAPRAAKRRRRRRATRDGFALLPRRAREVVVLARPRRGGARRRCWRCSPTAKPGRVRRWRWRWALSQRNVQRALDGLAAAGKVQLRWATAARAAGLTPPVPGFTTSIVTPGSAVRLTRMLRTGESMNKSGRNHP